MIDRFVTGSWSLAGDAARAGGLSGGGDDEGGGSDDGGFEDLETGEVVGSMGADDEDSGNGEKEEKGENGEEEEGGEASEDVARRTRKLAKKVAFDSTYDRRDGMDAGEDQIRSDQIRPDQTRADTQSR